MQVEQAVFTSADNGAMKGYQLVSRSPGIDRRLAQELCRWAPSHASLWGETSNDCSLNYFHAGEDWIAITRTIYGGPEYSRRGGSQVVTMMLAMQVEQFAGYDFNPLSVARTSLALGHLRLQIDVPERLPTLTLPRRVLAPTVAAWAGGNVNSEKSLVRSHNSTATSSGERDTRVAAAPPLLSAVVDLLLSGQRVAVSGIRDPLAAMEELIERVPMEERLDLSFTTGLKPSTRRPFRLHFLAVADHALRRILTSQGIHCLPEIP